ncbi:primosomal protein DnaI [Pontibacillus litoralis]|uniref:Primosomal protein DnaI n=1 Tax=Pontibacillus litoralis JSM 072002 TaxID=1385512 RepID=A0A0A5G7H1_9BACI|nr:primosomal protein DnaI [Pontibacillus litoralis]KGX89076.1 primosomal protein DnaI [Pontibacillus litoralis JSM 072002]
MEPIQASLKRWMRESRNFKHHYENMRQAILQDAHIKKLLQQHPQLTEQEVERHLIKFYEYQSQAKSCEGCPSIEACRNLVPGYTPSLQIEGKTVRLTYEMCPTKRKHQEQVEKRSFISSLYMPKDILEAKFKDLEPDDRYEAIRLAMNYTENVETDKAQKGLYFYGRFGVGKTHILGAMANKLANKRISSYLIYMPEFVREMKSSIQDNSLNEKIEKFKTAQVLMLDDIGAESMSPWFRDEVLGSILQYRMMERLPVFFTSNYSLEDLEKHLMVNNRGEIEQLKAGRIIERIRAVSTPVEVIGQNRRTMGK